MYTFVRKWHEFSLTVIVTPGRTEEAESKVALFQKVINLLQLFDDRYKRKVFR